MIALELAHAGKPLTVLCLGAHSDDIEIGAGATLMTWIARGVPMHFHWCVLSAIGARAEEAEASAKAFLKGAAHTDVRLASFQDGFFPAQGAEIKLWVETLKRDVEADIILTHRQHDAHQDHRELRQITWNTFRNHLILEYEIPKWDGDLGQPNIYTPLSREIMDRKVELLLQHFGTQRSKDWFDADTFRGLARLRGMECRAAEGFAEGFVLHKAILN